VTHMLPRIPACPISQADESLYSRIERTACFYGCDLDSWLVQFSKELGRHEESKLDLDSSPTFRIVLSKWSGLSVARLPSVLSDTVHLLPTSARLTFCEHCWDEDVRNGGQPYIRRHWLKWTTVHCAIHQVFLSAKHRSIDRTGDYILDVPLIQA
jgi:hypothetical protein